MHLDGRKSVEGVWTMEVRVLAFLALAPLVAQTVPPNVITTVAGKGVSGFDADTGSPAGGPIRFAGISSITRDSSGNWIVADIGNNRIRRLSPDFAVATTIAGTGSFYSYPFPETGKPTDSAIHGPIALAFSGKLLYVQDNSAMSTVDLERDEYKVRIGGFRNTDGAALEAYGGLGTSLAVHPDGRVFFATTYTNGLSSVRVFNPATNIVRNFIPNGASGLFKGRLHVVMASDQKLYAIDGEAFSVSQIDLNTGAATPVLNFRNLGITEVTNAAVGTGSTLFIADSKSHKVFRLNLAASGSAAVQTVAGAGVRGTAGIDGPAVNAQLAGPNGLYWDGPSGRLYIGETQGSRMLSVGPDGVLRLAAGSAIAGYSGDDKPGPASAIQSRLSQVRGLTADDAGNLYTCELITATIAASADSPIGINLTAGRIRKVTPATGAIALVGGHGLLNGLSSDLAVESFIPHCSHLAFDASTRSLFFLNPANSNGLDTLLKRIDTISGRISTVSSTIFRVSGSLYNSIAMVRGNVVIAEAGAHRLRMVTPQGVVTNIAGTGVSTGGDPLSATPAAEAVLNRPGALAAAPDGTIYFTTNGGIIRSLGADGIVRHVAGSTVLANAGDGGPAKEARFVSITRLAVDARKRIFVGLNGTSMIRMIDEQGNVNRFAGSTTPGFGGDGGNSLGALFFLIQGMTVDASGTLFVGDQFNHRIRSIGPATAASIFSITSGNGQTLDVGAQSRPLTVEVRNTSGQPVAGAAITFRAENGQLSANSATTGANGTASVLVRAGSQVGPVRVVALSSGLGQLVFELKAVAALSITEVLSSAGPETLLAPGSLARVKVENARRDDETFRIAFGETEAAVLEGSAAASGSVLVAIPDTLDAGSVEAVASEADRPPSAPFQIMLEATAPKVLDYGTVGDVLNCRVTGYGRSVDGVPAAGASAAIDGIEAEIVSFRVKSPGVAELQVRVPAEFSEGTQSERTLVLRIGGAQTEMKILVGS